mmetsp:Transcript_34190/g.71835  ORF Transcript_34190/g.71835 Transcript_34190/m.71835 type:complete len:84 (-) Transcript_34190:71-322(-)
MASRISFGSGSMYPSSRPGCDTVLNVSVSGTPVAVSIKCPSHNIVVLCRFEDINWEVCVLSFMLVVKAPKSSMAADREKAAAK